jgi:hypothetical protein
VENRDHIDELSTDLELTALRVSKIGRDLNPRLIQPIDKEATIAVGAPPETTESTRSVICS